MHPLSHNKVTIRIVTKTAAPGYPGVAEEPDGGLVLFHG